MKASFMSINSSNLSKPCFGCYFRRSLVNFKKLIILFFGRFRLQYMVREKVEEVLCLIRNL